MTLPALARGDVVTLPTTPQSLRDRALADDVRFILAVFVDLNGKPCAKLVPVAAADELEAGELGFAGFAAGLIGQHPHDSDLIAVPDLDSYAPIPFVREGLAIVHCDPYVDGKPWPFAPRVILKRALARLAEQGLSAKVGAEVEYFLVDRDADGHLKAADSKDEGLRSCYDARGVTRMYDHLAAVSEAMNALGWGNYANDHEDAPGQFEQNFKYAEALVTADRVITLRYLIGMLAEQRGMTATFMPKPFSDRAGNGLHFHVSLWDDDIAAFPDAADTRGLGLSPPHTPSSPACSSTPRGCSSSSHRASTRTSGAVRPPAPRARRGRPSTRRTAATTARTSSASPTPHASSCAPRTVPPTPTSPSPRSCTPVSTESNAPPTPVTRADPANRARAPPVLPRTLLHAVQALRDDTVLRDLIDDGNGVATYFADAKEEEFLGWHNTVTEWEIDRYLTAY